MFKLIWMLFGVLFTSLWRPEPPAGDREDKPGDNPDEGLDEGGKPEDKPAAKFTQEDVDAIVSARLEREQRKAEREQEEARRKVKEEALKEQGKFQEIAEAHAQTIQEQSQRITELESKEGVLAALKDSYSELEARYARLLEDRLSGVPEPFVPLLQSMSVIERADWLEKNSEKLTAYTAGLKPKGSPPSGPGQRNGGVDPAKEEAAKAAQQRHTRTMFS